jgi:gluconate 2-dehydrogenase alpha chain
VARQLDPTRVVLVGAGAVGGVALLPLTEAGLDVVALEAGSWLDTRHMAPDELKLNRGLWPPGPQKVRGEVPTSRANETQTASQGGTHPMMNAVGGTANHYMAQAWRLNPWDFRVRSATIERYGEARVPPDSTVEDWPLSYAELEPFYDRVEYAIGVSGKAGNLDGQLDPGGNIFEGPRSRDYPMPALRRTSFMDRMVEAGRSLNWNPFTGPAAITSQPYQGRPACVYHGYCMGAGCHVEAKSSPAVSTIPRALNTGRLNLVTEAHVTTIETDVQGRVRGVNYIRDGQEFFQPAEVVLLASYTYENVRLLLISGSAAYPEGLGNRSGQVGRHYFSHAQFGGVSALFPFDLENWYGTPGQGIALDDWADDNFDHTNLEFIGGGSLYVYTERRPMAAVNGAGGWAPPGTPNWGSAWKAHVMRTADRTHNAYIQRTTLPYAGNYLDLDPTARDRLGYPVVRLTASFRDNERNMGPFLAERMRLWYTEAGAIEVRGNGALGNAMGVSTHAYGGTRMGENPTTSVLDRWGFSHEARNLGILGGSVMGSSGARNPTLTAQALAWRTAERLASDWDQIAG